MSKINGAGGHIRYGSFETGSNGASKSSLGQKSKTFEPSQPKSNNTTSLHEQMSVKRGMNADFLKARLNSSFDARTASGTFALNASVPVTSKPVPPKERHKQGNKYDTLPTSRSQYDPDRYRTINRNSPLVDYKNGKPYFKLKVDSNAHFFNKSFEDKGAILKGNVEVDFSRTKPKRLEGGKTERYVYVIGTDKNNKTVRGYVKESSLELTKKEIKETDAFKFSLTKPKGDTRHKLVDGSGAEIGDIALKEKVKGKGGEKEIDQKVKLNYGQSKMINGTRHYYAFSAKSTKGDDISGWISETAIADKDKANLFDKKAVEEMNPPDPGKELKLSPETYQVTGGDPVVNKELIGYRVLPGKSKGHFATDYLIRSGGVINLGYNAAGVSNDTYKIDPSLSFQRAEGKKAIVTINLYNTKDANHAGEKPVKKMTFVYGRLTKPVVDAEGKPVVDAAGKPVVTERWGWLALDALKPKTPPPTA